MSGRSVDDEQAETQVLPGIGTDRPSLDTEATAVLDEETQRLDVKVLRPKRRQTSKARNRSRAARRSKTRTGTPSG